jgi:hypothetical protein
MAKISAVFFIWLSSEETKLEKNQKKALKSLQNEKSPLSLHSQTERNRPKGSARKGRARRGKQAERWMAR